MKKIVFFAFLLFCDSLSCDAEKYLILAKNTFTNKEDSLLYKSIDDTLYQYWKNGKFINKRLSLCGCEPNGFAIESNHEVKDSLWAFDWCGSPDSVVTIISRKNIYKGLFYLPLENKSELLTKIRKLRKISKKGARRKTNQNH